MERGSVGGLCIKSLGLTWLFGQVPVLHKNHFLSVPSRELRLFCVAPEAA
jgi:hypothetical protein